ncbi:MAG: oligosaccharide flippase family protein [Clostridiales bacterium]|nr:oligosaccharide flippase family protein [Clostridiales bacterium]
MKHSLRNKAATGVVWQLLERFGAHGVSMVVTVVLARLLEPEDYGIIALATVFSGLLEPFINSGMTTRLVQKKDADNLDFSTFFYFNITVSSALYLLIFFTAPFIARYYDKELLAPVIRVIGLNVLVYGLKGVQSAYVSRNMEFHKFFFATLWGTVCAAAVGVFMAYKGFGVWALVGQNLLNNIIDTFVLWIVVKWRPVFSFSFVRLKDMLQSGWKYLTVSLTNSIVDKIRSIIIGKAYSSESLAFYDKGNLFPDVMTSSIESAINGVILPSLSSVQDSREDLKSMLDRSIRLSMYILSPVNFGLIACGKPLVRLLLTDKWLPCLPFMYIFCICNNLKVINVLNQNVYRATGNSGLFLKIDLIKKLLNLLLLILGMWFGGITGIAVSLLLATVSYICINIYQNKKDLGFGATDQLKAMFPGIILSAVMAIPVYCIQFLSFGNVITLVLQVLSGALIYGVLSVVFRVDSFYYLLSTAKSIFNSKIRND